MIHLQLVKHGCKILRDVFQERHSTILSSNEEHSCGDRWSSSPLCFWLSWGWPLSSANSNKNQLFAVDLSWVLTGHLSLTRCSHLSNLYLFSAYFWLIVWQEDEVIQAYGTEEALPGTGNCGPWRIWWIQSECSQLHNRNHSIAVQGIQPLLKWVSCVSHISTFLFSSFVWKKTTIPPKKKKMSLLDSSLWWCSQSAGGLRAGGDLARWKTWRSYKGG
jgi:hypothetical protein